jgi:hypothetical protein
MSSDKTGEWSHLSSCTPDRPQNGNSAVGRMRSFSAGEMEQLPAEASPGSPTIFAEYYTKTKKIKDETDHRSFGFPNTPSLEIK